eukprot:COSAG01_NODE_4506_length_4966_cov_76.601561_9_plen_72_part_00
MTETSHTCHVRYVYAWRYGSRHVHILTIVILGGVPVGIAAEWPRSVFSQPVASTGRSEYSRTGRSEPIPYK